MRQDELLAVVELVRIAKEYPEDESTSDICSDIYAMIAAGEMDEHYDEEDLNNLSILVQDLIDLLDV